MSMYLVDMDLPQISVLLIILSKKRWIGVPLFWSLYGQCVFFFRLWSKCFAFFFCP